MLASRQAAAASSVITAACAPRKKYCAVPHRDPRNNCVAAAIAWQRRALLFLPSPRHPKIAAPSSLAMHHRAIDATCRAGDRE